MLSDLVEHIEASERAKARAEAEAQWERLKAERREAAERAKHGDAVNKPSHYTKGGVECIDAIEAAVGSLGGVDAFLTGQVIKYVWRWKHKGGVEDLQKAEWYLKRLIESQKR